MPGRLPPTTGGFTLIELILVIVIAGILAAVSASYIARPIEGAVQLSARAELVDQADLALRRLARDIQAALPNSVRVPPDDPWRLELLRTADAGSYRRHPGGAHVAPEAWLDIDSVVASFNVFGCFRALSPGRHPLRVAVYPTGSHVFAEAAADLAEGGVSRAGIELGTTDCEQIDAEQRLALDYPHRFSHGSPRQRLYLVEGPISYHCDPASGELRRFSGYPISEQQPLSTELDNGRLLARNVVDCEFRYQPGVSQRAGLVTLRLHLRHPHGGSVQLVRQVHVVNAP